MTEKGINTFIASVRADLRDIASIAIYMKSRGVFVGSTGKVASEAIKILANTTQQDYPVSTQTEAVMKLRSLGYETKVEKGSRYFNTIYGQLKLEKQATENKDNINSIVKDIAKKINQPKTIQANVSETMSYINPVDNNQSHPVSIKERTDVNSMRNALRGEAPMAEG